MSLDNQTDQEAPDETTYIEEWEEPSKPLWVRHSTLLLLIAILVGATFFRFIGRDFDQNTNQHPDERAIIDATRSVQWPTSFSQLLDPQTSPLNLRSNIACGNGNPKGCEYPWGSLPVYLARAGAWVLDTVLPPTDVHPKGYYLNDYNAQQQVGRTLASIFDLITVLLVFLIARRLYSRATALIATALVAFAVTEIQIAHYYISEPFLVCFMMGALYFSVVLMQRPSWWAAAGAGACLGFAIASKVTIAFFGLIIIAAIILRAAYRVRSRKLGADLDDPVGMKPATAVERDSTFGGHVRRGLRFFLVAAVFTLLAFSISEPYALWQFDFTPLQQSAPGVSLGDNIKAVLDTNPWTRRIEGEAAIQSGEADIPYTRQYVGTVPVLYHAEQLVLWGMGVIPGLIGLAGVLLAVWLAFRRRPAEILLLAGAIPYFLTIAGLEAKWMRYMLPLVPIVAILGAALLMRGVAWARARYHALPADPAFGLRYLQRNFFTIVTVLAVGFAFLWSVAFSNIYFQNHSRVQASAWIYDNVPDGSSISAEGWDDSLPLGLPTAPGQQPRNYGDRGYRNIAFNLYDDRAPDEELSYLTGLFQQTDYIVLSSDRLYGSIPRLPWRYPVQTRFYQLLYANKLGYVLVHTQQVTPELFGIKINDQLADESFTVYDHPRVDIFKKVSTLTDDQLHTLFATALDRPLGEYSTARHGKVTDDNSLMLKEPLAEQPNVGIVAWNPLAQEDTQWIGLLLWLLAIYIMGFAVMPLIFVIFKRLPDKGYPLAKVTGLLLVSWATWILASARLLPFTFWSVLLMLLLMGGLGLLAWRFGGREQIIDFISCKRRLILFYEVLFLAAFAAFLIIRMLNPDLWQTTFGGEKPMEVGFLNAILRSPYMPPADPFFAGGSINYYYQGQFIIACLIKLIGIDPAVAFNMAIPMLYAFTFSGAACVVYNLVAWSQRRRGSTNAVSKAGIVFALLSGVLMLVIGNLHALMQLVMINFPGTAQNMITWAQNLGFAGPSWFTPYREFNFWDPSRIINGTINEFPFWSFLYADLHPHLIDMPVTLLAATFGMNLAFAGRFAAFPTSVHAASWFGSLWARIRAVLAWLWGPGLSGALNFGVMAVALGALFAINSWDWPTYFGVVGGATLIALLLSRKAGPADFAAGGMVATEEAVEDADVPGEEPGLGSVGVWSLIGASLVSVVAIGLVSLIAYLPFFLTFKAFYTKIVPLVDGGLIENTNSVMHRTTLQEYIVVWAIFVFIAVSYLAVRLWSFPWSAALADLINLIPGGAKAVGQSSPAAGQAFSTEQSMPLRRLQRLDLAPSYGGAAAGTSMAFARATEEEFPARGPVSDPPPPEAGLPVGQIDESSVPEQAGDPDIVGVEGGLHRNAGAGLSAEAEVEPYPSDETEGYPNGWDEEDAPPAISHWVTDAHSEVQRQVDAVRRIEQRGVIPLWAGLALLSLTAGVVILQLATHQFLLALLIALIGGLTATLLSTSRSVAALFGGLLLVTALLVSLGVEVVYLADHLNGGDLFRMNTVFKFYIQVWILFSTGGAVAIYHMIFGLRERFARRTVGETPSETQVSVTPHFGDGSPEAEIATLPTVDSSNSELRTNSGNGASGAEKALLTHDHPADNWLVWSAEEIEEVRGAPAIDETEVASLVGLLPDGDPAAHTEAPLETATGAVEAETRRSSDVEIVPGDGWKLHWTPGRGAWTAVFALFLVASLLFTFYGTQDRLRYRFPNPPPVGTLSGLRYMETAQYSANVQGSAGADVPLGVNLKYDYEAINWMNKNIEGLATIAEMPEEYYRADGMRAASNTGLPMVVGGLHQDEQRAGVYARLVGNRQGDMNDFFTTNDVQRALTIISKYDIQYIYLGQLERARAGEAGIAKFTQMADPKIGILKEVFKSDNPPDVPGTIIYQVSTASDKDPKTLVGAPVSNSGLPGISITPLPTSTPVPPPTPPVDNPELKQLIANLAADPSNVQARVALVNWYRDNGYPLEAAKELEVLVKQDPSNVALSSQLGDMYTAAGMPDEAIKAWEAGRDSAPDNPDAHNKLGIAYFERKRYNDAATEFQAAVKVAPGFVESWFHLGEVYERNGDVENARKAYQSAIDNSKEPNGWKDSAQQRLAQLK